MADKLFAVTVECKSCNLGFPPPHELKNLRALVAWVMKAERVVCSHCGLTSLVQPQHVRYLRDDQQWQLLSDGVSLP
ncbi:MAG: hypothetical protein JWN94_2632 [Betaproteobacteria bacterium]|nr:hypothetical protein [Betaproteobacteria bacterium]